MTLRKFLFWTHLSAGVLAGLFVLVLSVTGILLVFEHPIVDSFAKSEVVAAPAGGKSLSADDIAEIARSRSTGAMAILLNYDNRANAPVMVHPIGQGDLHEFALNPYTGADFKGASASAKSFFEKIVGWHRWLGFEGKGRGVGRMLTGAANLLFLTMVATGIYLWLPHAWKWVLLRPKVLFRRNAPAGKARNFNWHHVFSFWALVPLFVIVFSGVVISYPWANAAFYRAFGAQAPKQGGPAIFGELRKDAAVPVNAADITRFGSLQAAVDAAKATDANWTRISLFVHSKADVPIVRVMVHNGNGVLPAQMTTLTFDRRVGQITEVKGYDSLKPAERARMWIRFVHTGEQYGLVGSIVAGLASLAAAFLVYTGLALSLHRLSEYRVRKQRQKLAEK